MMGYPMYQPREVYCPKCGNDDIEYELIEPPDPSYHRISMDALPHDVSYAVPAVIRLAKYVARCKKCGYKVEFSRPY